MVVPIVASHVYAGNGLRVRKRTNDGYLSVSGNGCLVKVSENSGLVEVTGNGCHVVVKRGTGSVVYVGNGGLVEAPPGVEVTYRGGAGKVQGVGGAAGMQGRVLNVFNENGKHWELPVGRCLVSLPKIRVSRA